MKETLQVGSPTSELRRLRVALLIGGVMMTLFVFADLSLIPQALHDTYLVNRLLVQLPLVLLGFSCTFLAVFSQIRDRLFALLMVAITFSNYAFIYAAWTAQQFAFPYEGTILYAFYCIFALGIPFRLATLASAINVLGFVVLLSFCPVYAERDMLAAGFVAGSLFIASYARYRLDSMMMLLKATNARLTVLSTHDELTGLLNRRALMDDARYLLSVCQRENLWVAVIMADMDEFKKYNDAFGHQQGDRAIQLQATILKQVFQRSADVIGRYGGEEFLVVVSGLDELEVSARCEAILSAWDDVALAHAQGASASIMRCSVGAAVAKGAKHQSLESLISVADKNLYNAKEGGRGIYRLSTVN
ncbi:GGDEF domain-containing protein [Alteromonas sp. CYL-A6]|uniref:GGDEF domain-containing protein n=1 Tax=Alteromonas nitratireducens TaxID=3390813 RepID=UPI0034B5F10A